jgi:hypothetical protein
VLIDETSWLLVVSMHRSSHCGCHDGQVTAQTRDGLFAAYESTIVSIRSPRDGWTDPSLVALERAQGAIVLTAWNPGFARPSREQNRLANEGLRVELEQAGWQPWPADGAAPDGSFHEPGWIVWGMDVVAGVQLASRYGQFAVYAYDATGHRETVPCPG